MAVFPDRIVLKNSKDGNAFVTDAIKRQGTDPIVSGEVVISQGNGTATMYTLDANGTVVPVGVGQVEASVKPAIILNFDGDATDTPITISTGTTFPSPNAAKFGTGGFEANNEVDNSPRLDSIAIERENVPFLQQQPWTCEFWYNADPTNWDDVAGDGLPQNFQSILSSANYPFGDGSLNIYLDAGTVDSVGGGYTTTSETSGVAFGAVVLGLGPGFSFTSFTDLGVPATGEIVHSGNIGVVDNAWHHIVVTHEGLGQYAIFIDGERTSSTSLATPIDYASPGNSGNTMPVGYVLGGMTYDPDDALPGVHRGFSGYLDAFVFYNGLAKYKGLYNFEIPVLPPTNDPIPQNPNTLERLADVNIPAPNNIPDLSILAYNASTQLWEDRASLPYDITGNLLGDLGDVDLPDPVQIATGEVLSWDATTDTWKNQVLELGSLGDISGGLGGPNVNDYLKYTGSSWQYGPLLYNTIQDRPTALSDLDNDSLNQLQKIPNVTVSSLSNLDVLIWNSSTQRWVNSAAPPADITNSELWQLSDVSFPENPTSTYTNRVLTWKGTRWEAAELNTANIDGIPTRITDLIRDVNVSYWFNDSGYLTAAALNNYSVELFGDVDIDSNTLDNGQMFIYRNGKWINEFGPPANIAFNSIGDLSDVTYIGASPIDPGTLTIEYMGTLAFDDPLSSSNLEQHITVDREYGLGMTAYRDYDQSGTGIYADRGRGVTLRSDVNYVRLAGLPSVTTNRPELRWETGDSGGDTPIGEYIGLKMPEVVSESTTYLLPGSDGDIGDVLATDGFGNLNWIAQAANGFLSQLQDVDVNTVTPQNGSILVYNALAGLWVTGTQDTGTDIQSIDDINDVSTKQSDSPQSGQALIWDDARQLWTPGDVQSDEAAPSIVWNVTAVNSSQYVFSGSGFTGFVSNPQLYVMRGQKYTFSKDVGAHPFQLHTTPGLGQTPYVNGVVGTVPLAIGDLEWTVPMNAPDTLYYQCTVHAAMQGTIKVVGGDTAPPVSTLTVQAKDGSSGTPTGVTTEVTTLSFNEGNGFSVTDLGNGEAFVELGSSFAPWYVDGQSTLAPAGEEPIKFVAGSGIQITTNPNAAIKEITFEATGGGGGGGGGAGGALDAGRASESKASDVNGDITFIDLGHNGTLVDITSSVDAWIALYANNASRVADAFRSFGAPPLPGTGVLAEFYIPAGTTVLASPGTNYFNGDTLQVEALYAAVRDQNGDPVTSTVTVKAYANKTYTAISGGSFGSG